MATKLLDELNESVQRSKEIVGQIRKQAINEHGSPYGSLTVQTLNLLDWDLTHAEDRIPVLRAQLEED